MKPSNWILALALAATVAIASGASDAAGDTGYAVKRPVMGGACKQCVWGPLAEFVQAAMKPYGYDIVICYNCNQADSPRYVAKALRPHQLTAHEIALGDPPPPSAPVDFGVTESQMLIWSYNGQVMYQSDGPQHQLRLIAKIEDPVYFLIAAKKSSGITDLASLRTAKRPIKILTDGGPWLEPVFKYYGITKKDVESWGGAFKATAMSPEKDGDFDLLVSSLASTGNNFESNVWTQMSEKYDLAYFSLPDDLRGELAKEFNGELVDVPYEYLRGVDHPIHTVGRSGHAVYGRADMPDAFAYTLAKAIDESHERLQWLNRAYRYDTRTVWKNGNVPLHPGAERYYREAGYLKQ